MIQCKDCEFYEMTEAGHRTFKCDPFTNVKEPECIAKWQLIRLDMLTAMYQGMLKWQKDMEPLQKKMMKFVEREMNDIDESDKWKLDDEQPDQPPPLPEDDGGFKIK